MMVNINTYFYHKFGLGDKDNNTVKSHKRSGLKRSPGVQFKGKMRGARNCVVNFSSIQEFSAAKNKLNIDQLRLVNVAGRTYSIINKDGNKTVMRASGGILSDIKHNITKYRMGVNESVMSSLKGLVAQQTRQSNVQQLCQHIKGAVDNKDTHGLFRTPGTKSKVESILDNLDKTKLDSVNYTNHNVVGVLKKTLIDFLPIKNNEFIAMTAAPDQAHKIMAKTIDSASHLSQSEKQQCRDILDTFSYCYRNASDDQKRPFHKGSISISVAPTLFPRAELSKSYDSIGTMKQLSALILQNWGSDKPTVQGASLQPSKGGDEPIDKNGPLGGRQRRPGG